MPLSNNIHNDTGHTGLEETRQSQAARKGTVVPSSLDFERIVNLYSIEATNDKTSRNISNTPNVNVPLLQTSSSQPYQTFSSSDKDRQFPPSVPRRAPIKPMIQLSPIPVGYTGRAVTRWILTILTGLMTGLVAIFIVKCTSAIETWRSCHMDSLWQKDAYSIAIFGAYASINLTLSMLSAVFCVYVAPEAIGSGIPEVKAYLNGVRVKRFTRTKLLLTKIVSTILSVSSGLVIGPEGPLVHIGAILGAGCTKIYNSLLRIPSFCLTDTLWSFVIMDLSHFSNDGERRDLVSIGAAAGFASAFGAPIGGLLFAMEEASSHFDHPMFLKTLAATAVATFCIAIHHGDLSTYSIISLGTFHSSNTGIFFHRVEELPLYVIVAVAGGLMGGLFVRCWIFLQKLRQRKFATQTVKNAYLLSQVAFVSVLTSTLTYVTPLLASCRWVNVNDDYVIKLGLDSWKTHAHQFNCRTGEINELAAIFFGSRDETISAILTDPRQFEPLTLLITGLLFFFLMTLTLGVALPSGIFMPTFLVGSSLGGYLGVIFVDWLGQDVSVSTFALLGAAALLAGIQRSTVSLCVIIIEGTGQVKTLIPVIITVVIARYVGDFVSPHGLYEAAIELSGYPILDHNESTKYDAVSVNQIMSTPVVTLGPKERASHLVRVLRESDHHGFPVVDPVTKSFLGLVRRDQIIALIECSQFDDESPIDHEGVLETHDAVSDQQWSPSSQADLAVTPLMHYAYHIKDDRYDHILEQSETLPLSAEHTLVQDEYDAHDWLMSVRRSRNHLSRLSLFEEPPVKDSIRRTLPGFRRKDDGAVVAVNDEGNLYIQWLSPSNRTKLVNIGTVMNRGAYCVTAFCPVSKVLSLVTKLGLRHVVVLGGAGAKTQVVGIITRMNLLPSYIKEKSAYS